MRLPILFHLLCCFSGSAETDPETVTILDELETGDSFWLERPHSMAVDGRGRIFVSDQGARMVFVWDRDGRFLRTIGKPGQGPGEFARPSFLDVRGEEVAVLDPWAQRIEVFHADGESRKTLKIQGVSSFPMGFVAAPDGGFGLVLHAVLDEPPAMKTVWLSEEGEVVGVVKAFPDQSFELKPSSGFSMDMVAYSGETGLHRNRDRIALACGYEPAVHVLDGRGGIAEVVRLEDVRVRPVTQTDREEFMDMEIPWLDGSFKSLRQLERNIRVSFPESMPYFSGVYPMTDGGYLVYELSKTSRRLTAFRFSPAGLPVNEKPVIELVLGWGGCFTIEGERLFALVFDDERDRFGLKVLKIP